MKQKQSLLAWLLVVTIISFSIFSLLFLVKEANHHCDGDNCPICETMQMVEHTFKQLGACGFTIVYVIPIIIATRISIILVPLFLEQNSLIKLKVRLDN